MWSSVSLTAFLLFSSVVSCYPVTWEQLSSRFVYETSPSRDSYDFVIVGGGLAGLVVASRLSEDSNHTILVIEAGDSGEQVQTRIDTPSYAYTDGLTGTAYDWAYRTAAQTELSNREIPWPRGKLLGGSAAINGMYMVRPAEVEVNAWQSLVGGDGADEWKWDSVLAGMDKSETFSPPTQSVEELAGITYNAEARGDSGPIHSSYTGYTFSQLADWGTSLAAAGIPVNSDPSSGKISGSFVATSAINPSNWTRSYSRSAYIDPLPPRSNLAILVNSTVTRLLFSDTSSDNKTVSGIEYVSTDGTTHSVNVDKEVILSSGVIGSPQILMVSGVGPRDVLEAAGISVVVELPGVGQHLQDHISARVEFSTTVDTAGAIAASGSDTSRTAEFLSFVNSATVYVNSSFLLGAEGASSLKNEMDTWLSSMDPAMVPSSSTEVAEGFKAIYNAISGTIFPSSDVGVVEMLLNMAFQGMMSIAVAVQHPLSQGRLYVNSSSVFDPPVIDPWYLSNPADKRILREGLKLARAISQIDPLAASLGEETSPGSTVSTDEQWDAWLVTQASTEYHPTGTCAMLPQDKGGVVNAKLQVHGLSNVRVVDGSIFPFAFSCHLMAPLYGVSEQAADIIRAQYNGASSSSDSGSSSSDGGSSSTGSDNEDNSALTVLPSLSLSLLFVALLSFVRF